MKLILNNEVPGLGAPGDVVEVKDGFGRNYLIPRGFAQLWNKGADKQIASLRRARDIREVRDLGSAQEIRAQLAALPVTLAAKSGGGGRLFGSITAADIVTAVTAAGGPVLDKRMLHLATPIKSTGSHTVSVKVHPEVEASLTVEVVAAG